MKNKQQEIIETASLLFSKKGIKKTSVDIISSHCGISKKTFYNCFTDKEAVVKDIVESALSETEKYIRIHSGKSLEASVELSGFFKFIQVNFTVFTPVFLSDLLKFYPEVNDLVMKSRKTRILPFFVQNIDRGKVQGCYRRSVNAKLTGELYFRQIDFAIEDDLLTASEKIRVLSYINNFFLHGLSAQEDQNFCSNFND